MKIDQGIEEILKFKPRKFCNKNGLRWIDAKNANRFHIETLIEKKGNLDVFLMKIDQGIEESWNLSKETLQ